MRFKIIIDNLVFKTVEHRTLLVMTLILDDVLDWQRRFTHMLQKKKLRYNCRPVGIVREDKSSSPKRLVYDT